MKMKLARSFHIIVICIICTCDCGSKHETKSPLTCASHCAENKDCRAYMTSTKTKEQSCWTYLSVDLHRTLRRKIKSLDGKYFTKISSSKGFQPNESVVKTVFRSYAHTKRHSRGRLRPRKPKKRCTVFFIEGRKKDYDPKNLVFWVGIKQTYMFDMIEGKFLPLPTRLYHDAIFTLDPRTCRLYSYSVIQTEIRSVRLDNTKLVTHAKEKDVIAMNFDNLQKLLFYSNGKALVCMHGSSELDMKKTNILLKSWKRLTAMGLVQRIKRLYFVDGSIMYSMLYDSNCNKAQQQKQMVAAMPSSAHLAVTPGGAVIYYCFEAILVTVTLKPLNFSGSYAEGHCQSLDLKGSINLWVFIEQEIKANLFSVKYGGKPRLLKTAPYR